MPQEHKEELIEIWIPVKEGGEAFHFEKQTNLKLVAIILNGCPLFLEKDFMLEKKYISKVQADNLRKTHE